MTEVFGQTDNLVSCKWHLHFDKGRDSGNTETCKTRVSDVVVVVVFVVAAVTDAIAIRC